ncbi:THAP domain-containing protein 4 isoform X2 [Gambusia affinis]|uniref:THAP domain-containing protein 4 isoform X2 n=1 Tax=Gambusia affinis TaxID=33528 RepID=UPI001CDD78E0|nr:THAP domain-containing protein 4 isoform X2 [Gambusia affinis]
MASPTDGSAVQLNPILKPLSWLLGTWESDEPGEGTFPTIKPFRYTEKLYFSHVGQPVINFTFNAFHAESNKPLHRECGFIRIQPGTNRVAFIIAQNSGLVEIEEGELTGNQLKLQSQSLGRISFAKEPHVQQVKLISHHSYPETSWYYCILKAYGGFQNTDFPRIAHNLLSVALIIALLFSFLSDWQSLATSTRWEA